MSTGSKYNVAYRRKRQSKTNYRARLKLLLSKKTRLVVRRSLNNIVAQAVDYGDKGDKIVAAVSAKSLSKFGYDAHTGNIPSAYLTGLLLGTKAKTAGVTEMVLDMGMNRSVKGSRIYAALKGVVDSGVLVSHSEDVLPTEERVLGKHIESYAASLSSDKELFSKKFSAYIKAGVDATKFSEVVAAAKEKILAEAGK